MSRHWRSCSRNDSSVTSLLNWASNLITHSQLVSYGTTASSQIRVLLVGPSLDIVGGQSVQLARLLDHLQHTYGVEVDFLPVNPRLPGPLRYLQRVKYVRTMATSVAYICLLYTSDAADDL